jgi:hypothetical protein
MCTIVEMSENLDFGGPEAPPKYETLFAFESTLRVSWMFLNILHNSSTLVWGGLPVYHHISEDISTLWLFNIAMV